MKKKKITLGEFIFQACMVVLFSFMFIICFYPFYYILIASLSNSQAALATTIKFLPVKFTLENFKKVFQIDGIWHAAVVSVARTVIGTAISLFFTSILAYTLTKRELPGKTFFYRFAIISMYINAGMIPWYMTMKSLGLKNNFWVYIIPSAVSVFNMILIKTYIESVSTSLEESARIDGAGYFRVYWSIILPCCVPILASIVVFVAVGQWNSWTDNMLLVSNKNLTTLQYILLQYLNQASNLASEVQNGGLSAAVGTRISPYTLRMTITMVVTLPILLVYPFMQKYFIQGIMIGAVKG